MSEAVDIEALRLGLRKTWAQGDFAMVANLVVMAAEELAESLQLMPGERVLDVACGSGNGALAAARRSWRTVVGVDFVPALLERARERAAAERLDVEFLEADAAELPFADADFDVVTSLFGVMFAPDQEQAAAELLRVLPVRRADRDGGLRCQTEAVRRPVCDDRQTRPTRLRDVGADASGDRGAGQGLFGEGVSDLCALSARISRQAFG